MRLIAINSSKTFGGQERFLELLAQQLKRSGHSFEFIGGPAELSGKIALRLQSISPPVTSKNEEPTNDPVTILNGNRALYLSFARKKSNKIWIYIQHSSFLDSQDGRMKSAIRSIVLKIFLRRVDAIVRVSYSALPDHWAPGNIHTIHNGVDLSAYSCRTTWRAEAQPGFKLLMVGGVTANKNQRLALGALVHLPQAELTVVGQGPEVETLRALAHQLGVAGRVKWMGHQQETMRFYHEADALLMLSRFEAMPFVVLESMACGTPVIGFPVGGVPEVIDSGVDGLLLPPSSTAAELASAIEGLVGNAEGLRTMGLRARAKIEAHFTADRMANEFLALITTLHSRKRGST